jgi:cell division septation protein DedD
MGWIKEKMHQARLHRNQIRSKGAVTAQGNSRSRDPEKVTTRLSKFFTLTHKLSWLAGGMALGSMIVIIVWKSELVDVDDALRTNSLSGGVSEQQRRIVKLPLPLSDAEGLRKDVILLTEQVQILTTSVSDLKSMLLRISAVADSIATLGNELSDASQQQATVSGNVTRIETLPSPAAGKGNVIASDGKNTDTLVDVTSTPLVAIKEVTPTASGVQTQETITNNGPWVINLASLPHKADAKRFMENAESKGVAAGLYQVTVRGKNYWRVHVPGFTSAAEAKAKASLIKEKLGLKDVWIAKR